MNFLHDQFDKLMLLFLILVFLAVAVFHKGPTDFAVRTVDVLTGALVGIITGKILSARASEPKA
jgi:hypothetical protein